jgi:hypothetical protein
MANVLFRAGRELDNFIKRIYPTITTKPPSICFQEIADKLERDQALSELVMEYNLNLLDDEPVMSAQEMEEIMEEKVGRVSEEVSEEVDGRDCFGCEYCAGSDIDKDGIEIPGKALCCTLPGVVDPETGKSCTYFKPQGDDDFDPLLAGFINAAKLGQIRGEVNGQRKKRSCKECFHCMMADPEDPQLVQCLLGVDPARGDVPEKVHPCEAETCDGFRRDEKCGDVNERMDETNCLECYFCAGSDLDEDGIEIPRRVLCGFVMLHGLPRSVDVEAAQNCQAFRPAGSQEPAFASGDYGRAFVQAEQTVTEKPKYSEQDMILKDDEIARLKQRIDTLENAVKGLLCERQMNLHGVNWKLLREARRK